MMKIMAINAGSSSLKFQLFDMPTEAVITKGLVERIGLDDAIFTIEVDGEKRKIVTAIADHTVAVHLLLEKLLAYKIVASLAEIEGVGHRVVHGGETFADSAILNEQTIAQIEELAELAPLHNPANIIGIQAFQQVLSAVPAVAVFDTAYHQTMPEKAFLYSLPYDYYSDYGIRKYGFHGTSHQYVANRAATILQQPLETLKLISCHLGNGASVTAIADGKSVDTSMGFTPLEGLTMGTRSGNLDPAVIPFLKRKLRISAEEVLDILNKKSGMLGLSGFSNDLRDIETKAGEGNLRAKLTLEIFVDRIKKYIGMYAATMGGIDAIVFTAGIGENSQTIREMVMSDFQYMGVALDDELNGNVHGETLISAVGSKVKVLVIPTNEEVVIARDVMRLTRGSNI